MTSPNFGEKRPPTTGAEGGEVVRPQDINEVGNTVIKEIREKLVKVYPTVIQYLLKNHPELIKIYDYYYEKAMSERWQIATEYAYRILRLYAQVKP